MLEEDKEADLLYTKIRQELTSIISQSKTQQRAEGSNNVGRAASATAPTNPTAAIKNTESLNDPKEGSKYEHDDAIRDIRSAIQEPFIDSHLRHEIDSDIKKMQINLQQSLELFHTIGDKFESISFSGLTNRIRDYMRVNIGKDDDVYKTSKNQELRGIFEENYAGNNMDKLTAQMGESFQQHPGEFGDIPELSTFFQTCSQLQRGLEDIKRQRNDFLELEDRANHSVAASHKRLHEIYRS